MSRAIKDIEMTNETAYAAVVGGGKTLSFESIEYTVNTKDDKGKAYDKDIVRTVSGQVKGGNMLCILGPSGSGKTSLVHIISGRIQSTKNKSHQVNGNVLVDGSVISSTKFRRMSGLVTQEDIFEPSLTVEETLMCAAALKLKTDEVSQKARVDEIIKSLQLDSCRQTCIGDDANPYLKGISGGEKRRVAIAMEILDPTISLLMLDEPTSGLDAAAAQMVVNLLRKLANSGMAVLTTLHQPRNSIMDQFDSVMVLAKGYVIDVIEN